VSTCNGCRLRISAPEDARLRTGTTEVADPCLLWPTEADRLRTLRTLVEDGLRA
jgi:hypothetical protein